jgi:hypothetical protein
LRGEERRSPAGIERRKYHKSLEEEFRGKKKGIRRKKIRRQPAQSRTVLTFIFFFSFRLIQETRGMMMSPSGAVVAPGIFYPVPPLFFLSFILFFDSF